MKKLTLLFAAFILVASGLNAQQTNTVTFIADLTDMISQGFDSATDTLEIRGLDWDDGADVTVTGDRFLTVDPGNSNLYQTTLTIVTTANIAVGDSLRWKFHGYPENRFDPAWEPGSGSYDGRPMYVQADGSTFDEGPHVPMMQMLVAGVSNEVTFKADLTDLWGTGVGYFDPAIDGIEVRGFWADNGNFDTDATFTGINQMTRNLDPGVVYETTITVTAPAPHGAGATTGYKFKTFPDDRWADGGWEIGSPVGYTFVANGASNVLDARVPNVVPKQGPLGQPVDVLFQCYVPDNALNRYDSSLIPREEITFLILKGDNPGIGAWGGDWVASDTLLHGAIACYDDGQNGDLVAGDYIFSRTVTFADSITAGGVIYKFGAEYPAASTISGSAPLDNAKGSGQNFTFFLEASDTTVVLSDEWPLTGDPVGVEEIDGQIPSDYTLAQNFPNPFNPSTKIRYTVPEQANVSLKIYDVLGKEVAELVNVEQTAGTYEASFDASRLSSGIYFYQLSAGNVTISKKMMLLK
jgi:hypothetical protein